MKTKCEICLTATQELNAIKLFRDNGHIFEPIKACEACCWAFAGEPVDALGRTLGYILKRLTALEERPNCFPDLN
jgi:hypothetical protein